MTPTPEMIPPRTRVVIYDERDFSPLTVTLLRFDIMARLWQHDVPVELPVTPPLRMPMLPVERMSTLSEDMHLVILRGVKILMPNERKLLMVLTSTREKVLWLSPTELPGQGRADEDAQRAAYEEGLREGARRARR